VNIEDASKIARRSPTITLISFHVRNDTGLRAPGVGCNDPVHLGWVARDANIPLDGLVIEQVGDLWVLS
jgi:hypothetical protein